VTRQQACRAPRVPRWWFRRVYVFQAQRADGSYLRDVLAVFCPVEVRDVARKNDNAGWRIRLNLASVELVAKPDAEDAGHYRVYARDLALTQIAKEREEIEQTPESEQKELALIYQAKGLDRTEAQALASRIIHNKEVALDTLVREELGIDPGELGGDPWRAAGSSFALFAVGAIVPVLAFMIAHGPYATVVSTGLSAVALAAIGILTSLFSGRAALVSALRQVVFGCLAAGVTYGIGMLLGVSLS
jgi:VIT1/CCC1 family predicted Fe2+/Mn2+ transporter